MKEAIQIGFQLAQLLAGREENATAIALAAHLAGTEIAIDPELVIALLIRMERESAHDRPVVLLRKIDSDFRPRRERLEAVVDPRLQHRDSLLRTAHQKPPQQVQH